MRGVAMLLSLLAALACAGRAATEPPGVVEVMGYVDDGARGKSDFWFKLVRIDERFVVHVAQAEDADRLWDVLQKASKTGNGLVIRYEPASGSFMSADPTVPTFEVRQIVYYGHPFTVEPPPNPAARPPMRSALDRLAEGLGWGAAGDFEHAKPALDAALSGALPTAKRSLALKTRGALLSDHAVGYFDKPTPEADAFLVAALADFRGWKALAPRDAQASYAVAGALRDLGAYEDALAAFHQIGRDWPDEGYWSSIRIGAVHRLRGEFGLALSDLDNFAKKDGPQDGMAFHYHRGWTLTKLGRYDEAVGEFTKGLEMQPDYGWALEWRACALANLGRPKAAMADHAAAQREFFTGSVTNRTPMAGLILRRADAVTAELTTTLASGPSTVSDAPCHGYPSWDADFRPRSPLLAQAGQSPPAGRR